MRTAHDWFELIFVLVIDKQFFCQHRLVIKHVDQKTQGAQIVAEMLKNASDLSRFLVNLSFEHLLNTSAHVQDSLGGLIQPQYRQHAAHLGHLCWHQLQAGLVVRITKE